VRKFIVLFLVFQLIIPIPIFAELSSYFVQGKKAYDDFEIDKAIALLEQAVAENSHNNVDRAELTQAYFLLGLSYATKEEVKKAEKAFENTLKNDSNFNINSSEHPPKVIEVFERVKRKLYNESEALISITSIPPFSKIFINSEEKGLTPLTLPISLDKKYLIKIEKDGYKLWAQEVYINQKQTKVRATLEEEVKVVDVSRENVMSAESSKIILPKTETMQVDGDFEMMKSFFAQEEKSKTNTWLWVGFGLAVATAGVTYAVLQSQNKGDQNVNMLPRATALRVRIP